MKKAVVLGIIIAVILSVTNTFALSGIMPETGVKIKIEKEWKGCHSGYTKATSLVIYTEDRWKEIWGKMHSLILPIPEIPKINFDKQMVLAVFMGEKRSGGYDIKISKISKKETGIFVEVLEKEPPPESLRTMALTSPYHIVVIKKYPLVVNFQSPQNSQEK